MKIETAPKGERSILHSHTCDSCGIERPCNQNPCPARNRDVPWECCGEVPMSKRWAWDAQLAERMKEMKG